MNLFQEVINKLHSPVIALVGRPNVGKSTLFNRILGRKMAVVHDQPGVTRDRIYGTAKVDKRSFTVIDTGGLDLSPSDNITANVKLQVESALKEADDIILVVDVVEGLTPWDMEVADVLRKSEKPIYVAANKADNPQRIDHSLEFYNLGLGNPFPVSAIHGLGINELLEEILLQFPETEANQQVEKPIRIAVVGKPNVGKSSLINAILGEERLIVDSKPGTTRDAVNITFKRDGILYEIVDTAGMRRENKIFDDVERFSVKKAIHSIQHSDVTWMVMDATQKPGQQDKEVSSYIARHGKACIFVINKWDLVEKDHRTFDMFCKDIRDEMALLDYVPIISVSALDKTRVYKILELTQLIFAEYSMRITTHTLNKVFQNIMNDYQPPMVSGRKPSPKYITQASTNPPTFVIFTSYPDLVKLPYKRYIENRLREAFGFKGVPIVLKFTSSGKLNNH